MKYHVFFGISKFSQKIAKNGIPAPNINKNTKNEKFTHFFGAIWGKGQFLAKSSTTWEMPKKGGVRTPSGTGQNVIL